MREGMWVLYVIKKAGPAHLSSSAATLSAAPAAPVDLRAKGVDAVRTETRMRSPDGLGASRGGTRGRCTEPARLEPPAAPM